MQHNSRLAKLEKSAPPSANLPAAPAVIVGTDKAPADVAAEVEQRRSLGYRGLIVIIDR